MFSYDPAYLNASASPPSDVSDYSCLDQVTSNDFQRAQMLFGGFTNADVEELHTPASSSCFSDASTSSYFANCDGSPAIMASMPQTPASEIAFQPQVYDNSVEANGPFVAEFFPYTSALPSPSFGVHVGSIYTPPPQFPPVQNCDGGAMYNKSDGSETLVFPRVVDISPPPYPQYPMNDNNIYEQERETGIISHHPTLTPNLVASSLEKHVDEVSAAHFSADNAMTPTENDPARSELTNERSSTNGNGAQTKKPKKKDGDLDWVHCTAVAVADNRNPDSPPTYRVIRGSTVRGNQGKSKTASKGGKRPRVAVIVVDANGKEKILYFRSCVVKYFERCNWDGCQDVVWTDRKVYPGTHGTGSWSVLGSKSKDRLFVGKLWMRSLDRLAFSPRYEHAYEGHSRILHLWMW
ncbi:hypothetical protein F5887DRAFT_1075489 [Amanita rubescens]|nr:hypothetical protein F5887DRAFT_1075489 [Amanita rubescens]